MRDQQSSSRRSATTTTTTTTTQGNSSSSTAATNSTSPASRSLPKSPSSISRSNNNNSLATGLWLADESDSDWDCGVGNLVIDLDSDQGRGDTQVTPLNHNPQSTMSSPHKTSPPSKSEHQATVNKGLKMKIKRTSSSSKQSAGAGGGGSGVAATSTKSTELQHEIVKSEQKSANVNNNGNGGESSSSALSSAADRLRQTAGDKDRKGRGVHKKERKDKGRGGEGHMANGGPFAAPLAPVAMSGGSTASSVASCSSTTVSQHPTCPALGNSASTSTVNNTGPFAIKKEMPAHDPYEFNAKVEDRIGFPVTKKIKVEKAETATSPMMPPPPQDSGPSAGGASAAASSAASCSGSVATQDKAVATQHVGVVTDPDCLGPCEPGTSVTLEGIVWHETDNGVLVVNVTWRGKTYVGTLLDATKHDWAPPRFSSDSPSSEVDSRTPKGRGKRGRGGVTPKPEMVADRRLRNRRSFPAPPSPARCESVVGKRRAAQAAEAEREASNGDGHLAPKRSRSSSRSTPTRNSTSGRDSPNWIECPEPNCFKKYKHLNGLKYHQTKAHPPAEEAGQTGCGKSKDSHHKHRHESTAMDTDESPAMAGKSAHSHTRTYSKGGRKPHTVTSATINMDTQETDTAANSASATIKAAQDNSASSSSSSASHHTDPQSSTASALNKDLKNVSSKPGPVHHMDKSHSDVNTDCKKVAAETKKAVKSPPSTMAVSQVGTESKTVTAATTSAQVFQLATAPIACLGGTMTVVTQSLPANQVAVTAGGTTVVQATTTQIPVGTATIATLPVTMAPAMTSQDADKSKKVRQDKGDKNKSKAPLNARPIVPAPVVTSTSSVHSSPANQSQMSAATSQLKAIQPRPTIMGEPSTVNPALTSLKEMKDKKSKKKKDRRDKDRPKESSTPNTKGANAVVPLVVPSNSSQSGHVASASSVSSVTSVENASSCGQSLVPTDNKHVSSLVTSRQDSSSTSVIKTVPNTLSPNSSVTSPVKLGNTDLLYNSAPAPQQQQQQQQQQHNSKPPDLLKVPEMSQKPPELQKQPSLQNLPEKMDSNILPHGVRPPSSLSLNSPIQGADRERSSDVHSPAYSDISDANDTAPTLENETEQKALGDKGTDSHNVRKNRPQDGVMGQGYPMYESAGQPPYLIPAVSHPGHPSTHGRDSQTGTPESQPSVVTKSADRPVDGKTASYNHKPEAMKDSANPRDCPVPPHYQNYARITSAYGYAIDPVYHMHLMATDPQYRAQHEKLRSEQERAQREGEDHKIDRDKTKSPERERKTDDNKAVDMAGGNKPSDKALPASSQTTGKDFKNALPKPPSLVSDKEREEQRRREMVSEQSLVDKKNENHQILKENLELKSQMENRARYEGYDPKVINARQQADMQMYYMYMAQQHSQGQGQGQPPPHPLSHPLSHPHSHPQAQSTPRKAPETITSSPKESTADPQSQPPSQPNKPLDGDSKHRSVSRDGRPEVKRLEDKLIKSESKTPSPRPSSRPSSRDSRSTPSKPRDLPSSSAAAAAAGQMQCMPSPYAAYYHQGYLQSGMPSPYPGQMPIDPRHPAVTGQLPVDPRQLAVDPRQLAVDPRQLGVDPRQLAMDPRHAAMLQGVPGMQGMQGMQGINPAMLGYAPGPFIYHSQMRYPDGPPHIDSEKASALIHSPGGMAPEGKALDLLQQHAQQYYSGTHKIHELKDAARPSAPSPTKPSPATTPRDKTTDVPSPVSSGKDSDKGGSPPPQRHVHTHHHTHVVGGSSYPIYGSYGDK